jgi:DNA-binding transcriptional MerR regulator
MSAGAIAVTPAGSNDALLTTAQVAVFAGVTERQLQFFDESGVLHPLVCREPPRGRGYTPRQAAAARVVGELRRKGAFHRVTSEAARAVVFAPQLEGRYLLVECGRAWRGHGKVRVLAADELVEALKNHRGGALVVEIVEPRVAKPARSARR